MPASASCDAASAAAWRAANGRACAAASAVRADASVSPNAITMLAEAASSPPSGAKVSGAISAPLVWAAATGEPDSAPSARSARASWGCQVQPWVVAIAGSWSVQRRRSAESGDSGALTTGYTIGRARTLSTM